MRKIIASTYATLDGCIDNPQDWSFDYFGDDAAAYAGDLFKRSDALLMGRKTYEGFAEAWTNREGEHADAFNSITKYVASTTLTAPLGWSNSHLLEGDLADAAAKLKQQPGKDILVYGTGAVVHTLLQAGLLDEHHSWVHPVIWGQGGTRLFGDGFEQTALELAGTTTLTTGVVILTHRPASS